MQVKLIFTPIRRNNILKMHPQVEKLNAPRRILASTISRN
ncbi:hypothetical protein GFL49_29075 [Rhizobium leguminosarum bv. viciae]|nr:hypothetical protein [Rhizobium leguminosarum bv. viciae]